MDFHLLWMMKKIRRIKKVPATTSNITNACINFLKAEGHSASRINTQGQWDADKQMYRPSGSRVGFPDIACSIKDKSDIGRSITIDIKNDGDKIRDKQIEFKKEWIASGGIFLEINRPVNLLNWYYEQDWIKKIRQKEFYITKKK